MLTCVETMEPEGDDELITFTYIYEPGWIARRFGFKPKTWTEQYIGECTVWHSYPDFQRCSTEMELELSDIRNRELHLRKKKRMQQEKPARMEFTADPMVNKIRRIP